MSTVEKAIRLYAWKTNYQTFRIVQGEANSRTFRIQLFSTTIPVDLTNCSVMLYAVKPDSTVVYVECEVLDSVNGLVSVTLSEQMAAVEGTVDCWVQIVGEGGTDLRFEGMNLEVGECDLSEKVRSADEMQAFLQKSAQLTAVDNEVKAARGGKSSLAERENSQDTALQTIAATLHGEIEAAGTELTTLIDVQKARIDNIIAHNNDTEGNTELVDLRVDHGGNTHESAGEAVRYQTGQLSEEIDEQRNAINTIDCASFVEYHGGYLNLGGKLSQAPEYHCKTTSIIRCEVGNIFIYTGIGRSDASSWIFYNDGEIVSYGQTSTRNPATVEVVIPDGVNAVRFSSFDRVEREVVLEVYKKGRIAYEVVEHKKSLNALEEKTAKARNDINELNEAFVESNIVARSKNLLNPDNLTLGGIQSDGSIRTSDSWGYYSTSDYIYVKGGESFIFRTSSANRLIALQYDSAKNPIADTYQNVNKTCFITIEASSNAEYIRVATQTVRIAANNDWFQVTTLANDSENKIPYFSPYTIDVSELQNSIPYDVLRGKKWAVLGDSFTAGDGASKLTEGMYAGKNCVYPYIIGNRTSMEIISFFSGGRTLAYPANPGSFTNSVTCPTATCYYQNVPEDVDYITIYLGINDGHHASGSSGTDGESTEGVIPIGTINDTTTATYYGAWNVVLPWLIENRPFAHIGILVSNGCDTDEYRTAQIAVAKKYGIPYIDLNGDERTPVMIRSRNPDINSTVKALVDRKQAVDYDGTVTGSVNRHPNDEAHEYESYFIENFLRSI